MSLFFRPVNKAQKDRTILKRIDQTLSRQGLPSALLHFILFIVIEWNLLQSGPSPKPVYLFGLALFVMAAWRFIMIAQFSRWYSKGPARWRDVFILSGFIHAGTWSSYLFYRMTIVPDAPIMLLGILYTAAIAAGGTFVYSLYGKAVRAYLFILMAPIAAFYLFIQPNTVNIIIGIGILALYYYLIETAQRVSDLVWIFLRSNHEYRMHLSELEQDREASTVQNSSNRQFIQQVLHRIKNPMSGLIGVMGLISVDEHDTENSGMLSIARRSGYSILDLITDFEAFIEQKDGTRVPQSVVFNLRKTLEHVLSEMGSKAHENGRELSYLYHPDVPERIEADPQWLSNAFRRLLDFTLDMADSGEITVKIGLDDQKTGDYLLLSFYFINNEIILQDLMSALERQMDFLPENEDLADQLTLIVAAAQFKALGATLSADTKGDLHKISVSLPIIASSQQASSFKPTKYMAGKSISLIDLSPQNERSLTAEFMSWNMNVTVWTLDRLIEQNEVIDTDFVFINVAVDDRKAKEQLGKIKTLFQRFEDQTHIVLYASELQHRLFNSIESMSTFVEKPVTRDKLLSALRGITETVSDEVVEAYSCKGKKILVAEDNLISQKVVMKMLQKIGVKADTCVNGEKAIVMAAKGDYDLILMDYHMPKMDGLQATQFIRKKESDSDNHIPIIGMTSDQTAQIERECLAAGMDDFVTKPLQFDAFVEVIQRWAG